jgi:hypothetical protein
MDNGKIIWKNGDFFGRIHDKKVFEMGGAARYLDESVMMFADKGYVGAEKCITPLKDYGQDMTEQ